MGIETICCGGYGGPEFGQLRRAFLPIATYVVLTERLGERLRNIVRTTDAVGDNRRAIPIDTRFVVVVCDRVNHDLLYSVKRQAASRGLPMVYCRHSLVDLRDKLMRMFADGSLACEASA